MAIITFSADLDPNNALLNIPHEADPVLDTRTETMFEVGDPSFTILRLEGTGFTYSPSGMPTGGTLTGFSLVEQGRIAVSVTGLPPLSLSEAEALRLGGIRGALLKYLLSGDDGATGSERGEVIITEGGNDTIDGGGGADYVAAGEGGDLVSSLLGQGPARGATQTLIGGTGTDRLVIDRSDQSVSLVFDLMAAGLTTMLDGTRLGEFEVMQFLAGSGSDNLTGGDLDDIIGGGGGSDRVGGRGGNDLLFGGDGTDVLGGGAGDDTLTGDQGIDNLDGGVGNDILDGGSEADHLFGDDGDDALSGGTGADNLDGGGGDDTLDGGAGLDILAGGSGNDNVEGGTEADQLFGDEGDDTLSGGAGIDDLDGGTGNDVLDGGTGLDVLTGGSGNDNMEGGTEADQLFGDEGHDTLSGGEGTDDIDGGLDNDVLSGEAGSDILVGGSGHDILNGGAEADRLFGGDGDDRLNGGSGADNLEGGLGNDRFWVDNPGDAVFDLKGQGYDIVWTVGSYTLRAAAEIEVLRAAYPDRTSPITLAGNELRNFIVGNKGDNILSGRGGSDVLKGGRGDDVFVFDMRPKAGVVDKILDFNVADDAIRLKRSAFDAIAGSRVLSKEAFHVGAAAADADDRIIYNPATGALFYDADGTGAQKPILFARLSNGLNLTEADFLI